ncbi:MAG TPA: hypothetical protein VF543_05460 [Pyrinomonadaceae bacterium]|jgi:hypothetical protein
MSQFLTTEYIELYKDKIMTDFETLLTGSGVVGRRGSPRWNFFHHCFGVLVGTASGDFNCHKSKARDYKFHIKKILEEHYAATNKDRKRQFTFQLKEVGEKAKLLGNGASYPSSNGYMLLVSWRESELPITPQIKNILYGVIDRAMSSKLEVYSSLPGLGGIPLLESCFATDGPAHRRIIDKIAQHRKDREIIGNEYNQSRKSLHELRVHRLWENKAYVTTKESWHLYWWSTPQGKYTKVYEGEILQPYTLIKRGNRWLIWANPYKYPTNSAL